MDRQYPQEQSYRPIHISNPHCESKGERDDSRELTSQDGVASPASSRRTQTRRVACLSFRSLAERLTSSQSLFCTGDSQSSSPVTTSTSGHLVSSVSSPFSSANLLVLVLSSRSGEIVLIPGESGGLPRGRSTLSAEW